MINDKQLDAIGKVLLVIFAFVLFMFSIESKAQSFSVDKVNENYIIDFVDEFDDTYYVDGSKIIVRGKLDLNEKQYKQLIKDIKKTLKYNSYELDRPNYAVIKYNWVKDSAWVYWDKKAFSVTKRDIKYLNSKL
tara:strand:+ start:48 stop:449 length:402 start_codon:yes stop_codon:yes gene_type:complete